MAPRSSVVSAPTALAKRQMAVEARAGRPGLGVGQDTGDQAGHEAVAGAGGVDGGDLEGGDVRSGAVAVNQVEPALPRLSVTSRRPSCQRRRTAVGCAAAGQELELVVAELDHLRLGEAGQDPGPGRCRRRATAAGAD